jgi:putative ABC transport system substrate-binding protein
MRLPLAKSLVEFGASEADYRSAIESLSHDGANAIMVLDSPDVFRNSALVARLVSEYRLPSMFTFVEPVEAGALMAYAFDLVELYKRAANNIDAILRGTNPGDIPFYQASKFELSINLKAAKQLGISVPPSLVASADKVVD